MKYLPYLLAFFLGWILVWLFGYFYSLSWDFESWEPGFRALIFMNSILVGVITTLCFSLVKLFNK